MQKVETEPKLFWRKKLYLHEYCLDYGNGVVTILGIVKERKRSVLVTAFDYKLYYVNGWLAERINKRKFGLKTLEEGKSYVEEGCISK